MVYIGEALFLTKWRREEAVNGVLKTAIFNYRGAFVQRSVVVIHERSRAPWEWIFYRYLFHNLMGASVPMTARQHGIP